MKRKGLGKGLGKGYYNIVPMDSHIHSLSAKGVKTKILQSLKLKKTSLKATGFEPIEVIKKGNKRGEIYIDENPTSPREWDNMGTMVAFHKRYDLGDNTELTSDQFNNWEELHDYLVKNKHAKIILPIYLYDHSGLRMKIGSFYGLPQGHAKFDSGQIGYIYTTTKAIKDMLGVTKVTQKELKKARKILEGEVETYDQYLRGDIFGYKIIEENPVTITKKYMDGTKKTEKNIEDVEIDSSWGYYGIDSVRDEVNSILGIK